MKNTQALYYCILVVFLLSGLGCQHSPVRENPYTDLFQSLKGNWKGCAIKTPVGPRPYDIHFRLDEMGNLNGIADPGPFSDHHWSYQTDGNVLWLKFVSTFRGNLEPTWLSAVTKQGPPVTFHSKRVQKLKVVVSVIGDSQNIEIYLHNKPHVSIHLVRANAKNYSRSDCID